MELKITAWNLPLLRTPDPSFHRPCRLPPQPLRKFCADGLPFPYTFSCLHCLRLTCSLCLTRHPTSYPITPDLHQALLFLVNLFLRFPAPWLPVPQPSHDFCSTNTDDFSPILLFFHSGGCHVSHCFIPLSLILLPFSKACPTSSQPWVPSSTSLLCSCSHATLSGENSMIRLIFFTSNLFSSHSVQPSPWL